MANKWLFTKYDAFNRPVYTGEYVNAIQTSRADMQALANSATAFESKQATAINIKGTNVNYTNNVFPTTGIDLFTINYYDDYNFDLNGGVAETVYDKTPITNVKSLATGSKIRILGTTTWKTNIIYYDDKGRPIYNYSKNDYLVTTDKVKKQLDFVGKVLETTSTHKKGSDPLITVVDVYSYDHAGRLLTQKQTINSQAQEVIASNTYDNLGQLISKGVGGKITQSRLQNVDYAYNIRGWLKNINNVNAIGDDLFAFGINYNDINSRSTPLFNGNICQTSWRTANTDTNLKDYTYSYDKLNRLISAIGDLDDQQENIDYDKNGNIIIMHRTGAAPVNTLTSKKTMQIIDHLNYTYDGGNRLIKVEDKTENPEGFKNDANLPIEYTYDQNGNMFSDANKGITAIDYNYLNLPQQVSLPGGAINYVYDATGTKQRKIVGSITTDYANGYQYENNVLQFFPTSEGYASNNLGTFSYIYQYKDHLGNVRLSYGDSNNDGAVTGTEIIEESNYYPFGLKQKGRNTVIGSFGNSTAQKYKYNGKELQDELGLNMYDYGARNYDPAIGRWMNIDPLAEKYFSATPYNYVLNSPVNSIDPDGMDVYLLTESGRTILALKEKDKKTDTMYAVNSSSITDISSSSGTKETTSIFDMKDTNGDGQFSKDDGVTVKSGLIGQLGKASDKGDGSYLSTSKYSKENENNYLSLFKYISDNSFENEFSLHFFNENGQSKIQLGTFYHNMNSPGVSGQTKSYHNHSDTDLADERMSMGDNGRGKPDYSHQANDFNKANSAQISYPNYVYFGKSHRLYNVTKETINYIGKINNSNALKVKK